MLGQEAVSTRPGLQLRDAIGVVRALLFLTVSRGKEACLHLLLSYTKGALWRMREGGGASSLRASVPGWHGAARVRHLFLSFIPWGPGCLGEEAQGLLAVFCLLFVLHLSNHGPQTKQKESLRQGITSKFLSTYFGVLEIEFRVLYIQPHPQLPSFTMKILISVLFLYIA